MSELTELGKVLHEQHFRILVLVSGLENRIRGDGAVRPLDVNDENDLGLLNELASSLSAAIEHNAFEEKVLFPLLCRRGEGELADLLAQEHLTIGPVVRQMQILAAELLQHGCDRSRWQEFRQTAETLVTEMLSHLQKEELMVVQRLDVFLDARTDHKLATSFRARTAQPVLASVAGAVSAIEPMQTRAETVPPVGSSTTIGVPPPVSWAPRRMSVSSSATRLAARRRSTAPRYT